MRGLWRRTRRVTSDAGSRRPAARPWAPALGVVEVLRVRRVRVGIEHVRPRLTGHRLELVPVHGVDLEEPVVAAPGADGVGVEARLTVGDTHRLVGHRTEGPSDGILSSRRGPGLDAGSTCAEAKYGDEHCPQKASS